MENMDFLPPSAPNLVFERESYMAYSQTLASQILIRYQNC